MTFLKVVDVLCLDKLMEARDISLAYHLTYTVYENNNVVKQYELVDGVETNVIEFV